MKAIGLFHLFMCHAPADAICSKNLTLWQNADNLINAVASNNKNTIVVVHSVGPAIVEAWVDHPNVTALVWAGVAGQEAGNSLVDVLYGTYNPSGRLPYTIAKAASDYGAQLVTSGPPGILGIPYTEGLNIDYRHFDAVSTFYLLESTNKWLTMSIAGIEQDRTALRVWFRSELHKVPVLKPLRQQHFRDGRQGVCCPGSILGRR